MAALLILILKWIIIFIKNWRNILVNWRLYLSYFISKFCHLF